MKKVVATILITLMGINEIKAQIIQSEQDELLGSKDLLQETKLKSNLLIQQIGDAGNALFVAEQKMDFSNKAFINQTGNSHNTRLEQTGSGNEALLISEGGFTKMEITQSGNYNTVFSKLNNTTTQLYSTALEQNGDGNNIELTLLGNNVIPGIDRLVSVRQTGNDLNFSGKYDSPDLPVQINQKSGTNGAGMSVSVITSAFYFPTKQ
jgi:hypothetical protein